MANPKAMLVQQLVWAAIIFSTGVANNPMAATVQQQQVAPQAVVPQKTGTVFAHTGNPDEIPPLGFHAKRALAQYKIAEAAAQQAESRFMLANARQRLGELRIGQPRGLNAILTQLNGHETAAMHDLNTDAVSVFRLGSDGEWIKVYQTSFNQFANNVILRVSPGVQQQQVAPQAVVPQKTGTVFAHTGNPDEIPSLGFHARQALERYETLAKELEITRYLRRSAEGSWSGRSSGEAGKYREQELQMVAAAQQAKSQFMLANAQQRLGELRIGQPRGLNAILTQLNGHETAAMHDPNTDAVSVFRLGSDGEWIKVYQTSFNEFANNVILRVSPGR